MNRYVFILLFLVFGGASPAVADCTGPAGVASQTRYDGVENKLYYCNDTDWVEMGGSGGGGAGSALMAGWPDVILCDGSGSNSYILYNGGEDGGYVRYGLPGVNNASRINFDPVTKNYSGIQNLNSTASCTRDIADYITDGDVFYFGSGGGGGCPAGFTEMTNLGCMQNANEGNGTYATAVTDCYDTYGARLPLLGDRHLAAVHAGFNFTLADNEWVQGGGAGASGECPRITSSGGAGLRPCDWNTDYRCFIPN
ncbi:hypothetical protein [Oricola indica]|uniref:hypothetical protein n=1 Tax=Oricola indica TaxID=2872591 RepID=UPI001CBCA853|nr:hypothetical protein [Oricola indica]